MMRLRGVPAHKQRRGKPPSFMLGGQAAAPPPPPPPHEPPPQLPAPLTKAQKKQARFERRDANGAFAPGAYIPRYPGASYADLQEPYVRVEHANAIQPGHPFYPRTPPNQPGARPFNQNGNAIGAKSLGIGGDILNWLLGYESTRFKQFLKQHGEEKITSLTAVRKPIASSVRLGFDMLTGGAFEAAHKKLGVDNFFHLFLVVNGKYRIEKNEVVNYVAYSKASDEEDMSVPLKGELTIDEMIQKASKGNEKAFWLEYNPLGNNCQAWVSTVLQKNGLMTPALSAFIKQDMEKLLKELPGYTESTAKDITDTASYINRILQLTTGGRVGFAIGSENLRDIRQDLSRPKRKRFTKPF